MGDENFRPIQRVKIEKTFEIAEAPVTQKLYKSVIGKNPSHFKEDDAPVEGVTWFDAVRFCNELSKRMNLEPAYKIEGMSVEWLPVSNGYRLPTEAEWEYACRAGSTTRFTSGDLETDLDEMGWWAGNNGGRTHTVAQKKKPNSWGVFDMHGNVWEWVWDWYGKYRKTSLTIQGGGMLALHPEYVMNENKEIKAVLLPIGEWRQILSANVIFLVFCMFSVCYSQFKKSRGNDLQASPYLFP